ncbi:MAG: hypothetical protein EA391_11185 [Balneolaceae bacterium]|nr:MAG: hypothetical protein EA391_11185 [Balneolaceae bacterium]
MDYSQLVFALKNGDTKTSNRLIGEATPILKKYLISKVNASPDDADDAIQQMYEYVIPKIISDEIKNPAGILAYMLKAARHSYYKILRDFDLDKFDEIEGQLVTEADQAWKLMDEEQASLLMRCIEGLRNGYRDFAAFIFSYPGANTEDIAEKFGLTPANAWTRKHRVLKKIIDCVNM